MSILSAIKNFAYEVLGIEKNDAALSADKKREIKTPVIECKTEVPEDKVEISNKEAKSENAATNAGGMKKTLELLGTKHGFDLSKLLKEGLIEKMAGEFSKLTPEDRKNVFKALEFTLSKLKNIEINSDASESEVLAAFAKLYYEAVSSGEFESCQEFDTAKGDINKELGEDFKELDTETQRDKLKQIRKKDQLLLEQELDGVKELPKIERAEAENRIRARHRRIQRGRFMDVVVTNRSEAALNSMVILNSQDMDYGFTSLMDTRCSNRERTRTADMATYDFTKSLISDYQEVGDEVAPEVLQNYTATVINYMSSYAAEEYKAAYEEDKKNYETAVIKQQKGEKLTEKEQTLLRTMKPEYFEATEKAVTPNIIAQTPVKPEKQVVYKELARTLRVANTPKESDNVVTKQEPVTNTVKRTVDRASYPIVVAKQIKSVGIVEAMKKYSQKEVIATVLNDKNLKHLRPQLTPIIKSCDIKALKKIAADCSDSSFVFICSIVGKDKFEELTKDKKDLCFQARQLVENMEEQYAAN